MRAPNPIPIPFPSILMFKVVEDASALTTARHSVKFTLIAVTEECPCPCESSEAVTAFGGAPGLVLCEG